MMSISTPREYTFEYILNCKLFGHKTWANNIGNIFKKLFIDFRSLGPKSEAFLIHHPAAVNQKPIIIDF